MAVEVLPDAVEQLWETGKYSDLEIRCGNLSFKVHKSIVCMQSAYFANAVDNWRFTEAQTGVIEMQEQNPEAVRSMLKSLYARDYTWPDSLGEADGDLMLFHLDSYAVADLIQHKTFKREIELHFKELVARYYIDPSFPEVVRKTFEVSPPGAEGAIIRDIIVNTTAKHAKELLRVHEDFEVMIEQIPAFAAMLAVAITRLPQEPTWTLKRPMSCVSCKQFFYADAGNGEIAMCPFNCATSQHRVYVSTGLAKEVPSAYQCSIGHRFATFKTFQWSVHQHEQSKWPPHLEATTFNRIGNYSQYAGSDFTNG